ncbi:MAG: SseB family protein, partial [Actinoallomurus sp.]
EWWLAVNSGLPIEGYLPAWFIGQITAGQERSEQVTAGQDRAAQTSSAQEPGTAPADPTVPAPDPGATPVGQETGLGSHTAPPAQDTGLGSQPASTAQEKSLGSYVASAAYETDVPAYPGPATYETATGAQSDHDLTAGSDQTPAWNETAVDMRAVPEADDAAGSHAASGGQHTVPPVLADGTEAAPPVVQDVPEAVPPAEPQALDPGLAPTPPEEAPASDPNAYQPVPEGLPPAPEALSFPGPGFAAPTGPDPVRTGDAPPPYPSFSTLSAVPPAPGVPSLAATAPQPIVSGDEPMPSGPDEVATPAVPSPEAAPGPATRPPSSDVPLALHFTAGAEFVPLDEEERLLHDAAARDDREEFLRTLLGVRQIWVPMVEGGDPILSPGRPGFQWHTRESGGRTVVPLFTGPGRMREVMGGHPFVLSDLAKVLRFWPDRAWDLVINDGSPIGATIPGERVTALSRQVDDDAAERIASDFPAQNDVERRLFEAREEPAARLTVLLEASVFLPVWSRTPPTMQTPPDDPAFPWSAVSVRGRTSVLVFTSFDWMKEAVGTTGFVMPTFADLIAAWPEPDWDVSVNPGTPIEIALSAEEIRAIAGGTVEPAPGGSEDGTAAPWQASAAPPEAMAVAEAPPEAPTIPAEPLTAQEPGEAAPQPSAAQEAAPSSSDGGGFAIMQKVVAHDQVPWYLDKAYDRVAGFVHRVSDVIDLNTPRRLYECLGLVRDGSPFTVDDPEVHVIRWPAYRAALYRTPFGGTSEDALKEWGEDGWVVEDPPFTGDGFTAGSAGSIPEYKAESVRLPHGSEMYAITSDGSERFVARYDADRLVWESEK